MNPFASFAAPVVFKAGAIPILVDHLNHDMARVRIEATRALWSLAENNLETWEERDGLERLLERTGGVVFLLGWVVVGSNLWSSELFFL